MKNDNGLARAVVRFALVAFLALMHLAVPPAWSAQTQRFGKTLLVEHRLPDGVIKDFNKFKPSEPAKGESVIVATMLADTKDWAGPPVDGRTGNNPYTIVVLVKGVVKNSGDVATMWHAGWRIQDSKDGEQNRMTPLAGIAKAGAKAGETVEMLGAALPTSFKEDRSAAPMIGLVNARNLDITEVRVQVWSGMASSTWMETLLSFRWALIGVVLVVLWWFWFRRS